MDRQAMSTRGPVPSGARGQQQQQQQPPVLLFSERYSPPCREVMAWLKNNPPARGALRCACIDGQVDMVPPSVTGVPALYLPDTGTVLTGDMMMATLVRIVDGGGGGGAGAAKATGGTGRSQQIQPRPGAPEARGTQRPGPPPQPRQAEPEEFPYETGDGYEYVGLRDSGDGVLVFDEEDHGLQFFASADGSGPVPAGAAYPRTDGPGAGDRAGASQEGPPGTTRGAAGKPKKIADNTLEMMIQERSRDIQGEGGGYARPGHGAPGGGAQMSSGPARFAELPPGGGGGGSYGFR
jgi:hypothetical protein